MPSYSFVLTGKHSQAPLHLFKQRSAKDSAYSSTDLSSLSFPSQSARHAGWWCHTPLVPSSGIPLDTVFSTPSLRIVRSFLLYPTPCSLLSLHPFLHSFLLCSSFFSYIPSPHPSFPLSSFAHLFFPSFLPPVLLRVRLHPITHPSLPAPLHPLLKSPPSTWFTMLTNFKFLPKSRLMILMVCCCQKGFQLLIFVMGLSG